jgi:hypothetical protein
MSKMKQIPPQKDIAAIQNDLDKPLVILNAIVGRSDEIKAICKTIG